MFLFEVDGTEERHEWFCLGRNGTPLILWVRMEAPPLERKLVAILAADIEGFSSHMERDEVGTLAVLSSHRLIIDASIAEFGGRITSTAGDSVLAEFASVLSVINCAVQIQDLLAAENAELDEGSGCSCASESMSATS